MTCFRPENVCYKLPILQVVKLQPYLDYFQNTYSKMKTNIRFMNEHWSLWHKDNDTKYNVYNANLQSVHYGEV